VAAADKVANLRLTSPSPQGIAAIPRTATAPPATPRQTFPLSPESVEMNQKVQAAKQAQQLRNLEADKAAAEAASKGVTTAQNAAKTSEAMEMANAARAANMANRVISPANKAVSAARQIQAGRVGSDMPSADTQPDYQSDEAGNLANRYPAPVVDDRTKRDLANYKPEEKKQIVAAAKDALPKTEDTDGWSKNDWLQFGLSMMAGQSPFALTNIGAAGLGVIASKAEREKQKNTLANYKAVHGASEVQIAERLMADDPSLSFQDALEKGSLLIGGNTKQSLAAIKAEQEKDQRLKNYVAAVKAINPMTALGAMPTASPQQKQAYQNELKQLQALHKITPDQLGAASSPTAVPPIKVVGVER